MAVQWSWQCSGHGSAVVMAVQWSWQYSGHGSAVVMAVQWSWQCSGHGSAVVMAVQLAAAVLAVAVGIRTEEETSGGCSSSSGVPCV